MEESPEISKDLAFRSLRKNSEKIFNSEIDPFILARKLDSEEMISEELYMQTTDKSKDWSHGERLESLIKYLRTEVKKDGEIFVKFVEVLNACNYHGVAEDLVTTYQTLAKDAKMEVPLSLKGEQRSLSIDSTISESSLSKRDSLPDNREVQSSPNVVTEGKGYEEFTPEKYGEPKFMDLLDWVVYKIPGKWYTVGLKLGFGEGVLDGIKIDISNAGDPKKMFREVLSNWGKEFPSRYRWDELLQILASPSIGETRLANEIATRLKGQPYFGPEQPQFNELVYTRELNASDVENVYQVLTKVVERNYSKLSDAVDSSLPSFARLLLEAGIIPRDACKKPDYNSIMQSFTAGLAVKSSIVELEEDCQSFIKALKSVGGPGKHAAQMIAQQWKQRMQTDMGVYFNVEA